MNDTICEQLQFIGLKNVCENWDAIFDEAKKKEPSYHRFLTDIIEKEYLAKKEKARLARIKKARIPELFVMETFPFAKQPRLKKKLVLELYDSMKFITEKQDLVFIGPTGCGKTGLGTAFLVHAINQGCRGYFVDFRDLIDQLFESQGDHTENKVLKRFQSYEILMIDELGYAPLGKDAAGLFFDLMKRRNKNCTTIVTTQLGFDEWENFLKNNHITAALLDRMTVNCTVFNMKECISIRPKKIVYATKNQEEFDRKTK